MQEVFEAVFSFLLGALVLSIGVLAIVGLVFIILGPPGC